MSYGRLVGKKERLYVPIGAGNALKYGISGGAALLDIARRAGLPVPPGIILVDEAYRRALGNGLIRLQASGAFSAPSTTLSVSTCWAFTDRAPSVVAKTVLSRLRSWAVML